MSGQNGLVLGTLSGATLRFPGAAALVNGFKVPENLGMRYLGVEREQIVRVEIKVVEGVGSFRDSILHGGWLRGMDGEVLYVADDLNGVSVPLRASIIESATFYYLAEDIHNPLP